MSASARSARNHQAKPAAPDLAFVKGLPAAVDSEQIVLGSILTGHISLATASARLDVESLSLEKHRRIFARMQEMDCSGEVDRNLLAQELIRQGQLESVDGLAYLNELADIPSIINIEGHFRSIKEKSMLRKMIFNAQKTINVCLLGEKKPDEVLKNHIEFLEDLRGAGQSTNGIALPPVRSGYDLYDSTAPDLRPLVRVKASGEALLMDGLSIFAARQKAGKSWEALQLAIAVAGGPEHDGLDVVEHGPVLYIALEEPEVRTRARIQKLAPPGEWLKNLHFVYQLLPLMAGGAEQLRELIRQCRPRLVVIDTLTALVKAGGSKNNDVFRSQYSEVTCVRQMAEEFRAAFLLIHHLRKALTGDPVEAVAGTGGITAGCDSILVMKRKPEGRAELEITGREIAERAYALEFSSEVPFGWRFIGDGAELAGSEEQMEVLALLKEDGAMTPVQIATELGKSRPGVRQMLRRMCAAGKIDKIGKQYRHPTFSLYESQESQRERGRVNT